MTFEWPLFLLLLLVIPALVALYVSMQRRRQKYALRYASVSLVSQAVGKGPGVKRHVPAALYLVALAAMIVALARPHATIPVPSNTGTVILTVDVSGSMFAEDAQPNRMEATKKAMREFVNNQPDGIKIGVVSFSDFGALVAPPTYDRKTVQDAIARLRPQGGTNIGAGLQVALDAIFEGIDGAPRQGPITANPTPVPNATEIKVPPSTIVLLSDGETKMGPDPVLVADEAVQAGIKVYTIGIGTPEGTVLRIQGRNVFTRLDDASLREIAQKTDARYFEAVDEKELVQVYNDLSRERQFENEEQEVTFALTGAALVLSIIAGGLGLLWFNRLP